jgi:hypothetical protein
MCCDRKLELREMMLGQNSALVLHDVLVNEATCGKVAHLDLTKNNLGDKGLEVLAPAFIQN